MTSNRDDAVVNALLTSFSVREAAQKLGISESTVYAYAKRPAFRAKLDDARRELNAHTTARLQQNADKAVDCLVGLIENDDVNEQTRLGAARAILDFGLRYGERLDVEQKIAELEQTVESFNNQEE